ncbi:MAG: DNA-3-methyladenine glycosylase [candidate division Zixibacteria bacterium]|nr:DNA-3-methyladenine glycosylase [candidate division Zixibacteria bacterium]
MGQHIAKKISKRKAKKLTRAFFGRPTLKVARDLIGKVLADTRTGEKKSAVGRFLRIVEVEAYIGEDDPACHASVGPTERNRVMYGSAGFAYVYLIYGMYHCLNFVTERKGYPAAVLIRAGEPLERGIQESGGALLSRTDGPGRLCRALGITRSENGLDLTGDSIYVQDCGLEPRKIATGPRIGIRVGKEKNWRFFDPDSKFLSKARDSN